ncbi:MAG: GNAT family N-acetyltransferase, partial [Candidatus Omnitrophota bacterium]
MDGMQVNEAVERVAHANGKDLGFIANGRDDRVDVTVDGHGYMVVDTGCGMEPEAICTKLLYPSEGRDIPEPLSPSEIIAETEVFFAPNGKVSPTAKEPARVGIQVAGVIIEDFDVDGYNMPRDSVVELPASTELKEEKGYIQLDVESGQTMQAFRAAIDKVLNMKDTTHQVELINAVAHILVEMSERDERALELLQYFANELTAWRAKREGDKPDTYIYLPNEREYFNIAIPVGKEAVYINKRVMPFTPQDIPGARRIRNHLPTPYHIWVIPFSTDTVSVQDGRLVILNLEYYEAHKDNPAAFDLEVNPIETGYEPDGHRPRPIVRILPEAPEETEEAAAEDEPQRARLVPSDITDLLAGIRGDSGVLVRSTISPMLEVADDGMFDSVRVWLRRMATFLRAFPSLPYYAVRQIVMAYQVKMYSRAAPDQAGRDYAKPVRARNFANLNLQRPTHCAYISEGKYAGMLAVCNKGDNSVSIVNPSTGEEEYRFTNDNLIDKPRAWDDQPLEDPYGVAMLPGGNLIVTNWGRYGVQSYITIIDVVTCKEEKKWLSRFITGNPNKMCEPKGIAILPGGMAAVCCREFSSDEPEIIIINLATGKAEKILTNKDLSATGDSLSEPTGIALLSDGNLAVSNFIDNTISIIDPDNGKEVRKLRNEDLSDSHDSLRSPTSIVVLPDDRLAVCNQHGWSISIINPTSGKEESKLDMQVLQSLGFMPSNPTGIALLPDGNMAVTGNLYNSMGVIEFAKKESTTAPRDYTRLKKVKKPKTSIDLKGSGGSTYLAGGHFQGNIVLCDAHNNIIIVDPHSGIELKKIELKWKKRFSDFAFIQGDKVAGVESDSGNISIINLYSKEEIVIENKLDGCGMGISYIPNRNLLAICSNRGQIRLIDPDTGGERILINNEGSPLINMVYILAHHALAVTSNNGYIKLIDPDSGAIVDTIDCAERNSLRGLALLSDNTLAVGDSRNNIIHIIDINRGEAIAKIEHEELRAPQIFAFIPNGEIFVSIDSFGPQHSLAALLEFDEKRPPVRYDYTSPVSTRVIEEGKHIPYVSFPGSAVITKGEHRGKLAVAITRDGDRIIIQDPDDGSLITTIDNARLNGLLDGGVRDMAVLPSGDLALCSVRDNSIIVIDPEDWSGYRIENNRLDNALNNPAGIAYFANKYLVVCNTKPKKESIVIIDPVTWTVISKIDNAKLNGALDSRMSNMTLLTSDKVAMCSPGQNPYISIIDLAKEREIARLGNDQLDGSLYLPFAVSFFGGGKLGVWNFNGKVAVVEFNEIEDVTDAAASLPDEPEHVLEAKCEETTHFLREHSVYIESDPSLEENYLFNAFYLPEQLSGLSGDAVNIALLCLKNRVLELVSPEILDTIEKELLTAEMSQAAIVEFFGLFNDIDVNSLDMDGFSELVARWIRLFKRLKAPAMEEARAIFSVFVRENRSLLEPDFDTDAISDDFAKKACMYLRGDIKFLLAEEDRVAIEGKEHANIDGLFLSEINAVFKRVRADGIREVSSLSDYEPLLSDTRAADPDLTSTDRAINKTIVSQDKSENIFVRENVQNARDAIITERLAADCLFRYYSEYKRHKSVHEDLIHQFIPSGYEGRAHQLIVDRMLILDRIISNRQESGLNDSRKKIARKLRKHYNKKSHVAMRSYIPKGTKEWVVSVEDDCGMELSKIFGPLFVIDDTDKIGSLLSEGILGRGLYTNFADFDELRITTGVGLSTFHELTITRRDGRLVADIRELEGNYKGTRIERVKRFKEGEYLDLDAIFVEYSARRYTSALQNVDIIHNNERINEDLRLLGSTETPYGTMRLYDADTPYQRVTRNLLYVEYPKSREYFALVPEHYLKIIRSRGLTIDLPAGIDLVRTRLTVARKEIYMPVIQRAVAALCLKAMVKLFDEETLLPPGLSEDYLRDEYLSDKGGTFDQPTVDLVEAARDASVEPTDIVKRIMEEERATPRAPKRRGSIEIEADLINNNELEGVNFSRYLVNDWEDEKIQEIKYRSLKYLITLIAVPNKKGKPFSLAARRNDYFDLRARAQREGKQVSADEAKKALGMEDSGMAPYLDAANRGLNADQAPRSIPDKTVDIATRPDLQDFGRLTEIILKASGMGHVKSEFYWSEEPRLANFGPDTIIWNTRAIEGAPLQYPETLQKILSGEIVDRKQIYWFFRAVLHDTTHEVRHFYDIGKASHESAREQTGLFAWAQREILRDFVRSKKAWPAILHELKPDGPREQATQAAATSTSTDGDEPVRGITIDRVQEDRPHNFTFQAFIDGKPAGHIKCANYEADRLTVRDVKTDPNMRLMGIGEALMRRVKDEAISSGMDTIVLPQVRQDNVGGLAFYEKMAQRLNMTMSKLPYHDFNTNSDIYEVTYTINQDVSNGAATSTSSECWIDNFEHDFEFVEHIDIGDVMVFRYVGSDRD